MHLSANGRAATCQAISEKRLIFTVTTGRSGTAYLSTLFGYVRNTHTFHEPAPEFVNVLRQVQDDSGTARDFLVNEKLPVVASDCASVYVETSHLVCKGFLEPLLSIGIVPDLIIHRRAPRDVAKSMFKMGTIPGRSDKGLKFYLSPADPDVMKLNDWQNLTDYQLCYWYCIEIERRARRYKKLFSKHGARIAETTLLGLKTIEGFDKLLVDLDLTLCFPAWFTRLRFKRNTMVKVNESRETKKDIHLPKNIDVLERQVMQSLDQEVYQRWFSGQAGELFQARK